LSLTRIVLLIPFTLVMFSTVPHREFLAFGLFALAALTDRYDGYLARKWHSESEWGRILDPLADKIGSGVSALVLVIQGYLPAWFLGVVVARDALILAGGIIIKRTKGEVLPSNTLGKWAMGVVFVTFCAALLNAPSAVLVVLLSVSVLMLALSLVQYARRFLQAIQSPSGARHGIS
jgi:CDP-diacylglycerol--glycerol-3-phosphate 3-phosphatidyltransferase